MQIKNWPDLRGAATGLNGCESFYLTRAWPYGYNVITLGSSMVARIVRIGNSQGLRIPKPLIAQIGIRDEVEIKVYRGTLVIRPVAKARAGWAEAFKAMAQRGDDGLLDADSLPPTVWDEEESSSERCRRRAHRH